MRSCRAITPSPILHVNRNQVGDFYMACGIRLVSHLETHPIHLEFYQSAVAYSEVPDKSRHYFVDDSLLNVKGAKAFGWDNVIWFDEGRQNGKDEKGEVIGDLEGTRGLSFLPLGASGD